MIFPEFLHSIDQEEHQYLRNNYYSDSRNDMNKTERESAKAGEEGRTGEVETKRTRTLADVAAHFKWFSCSMPLLNHLDYLISDPTQTQHYVTLALTG